MKFSWQEYCSGLPCAVYKCCCSVAKSCLTLLQTHGLQLSKLLCPWHIPGKNTGVGCHFLLQGLMFFKDHWLLYWEVMEVGEDRNRDILEPGEVVFDSLLETLIQTSMATCSSQLSRSGNKVVSRVGTYPPFLTSQASPAGCNQNGRARAHRFQSLASLHGHLTWGGEGGKWEEREHHRLGFLIWEAWTDNHIHRAFLENSLFESGLAVLVDSPHPRRVSRRAKSCSNTQRCEQMGQVDCDMPGPGQEDGAPGEGPGRGDVGRTSACLTRSSEPHCPALWCVWLRNAFEVLSGMSRSLEEAGWCLTGSPPVAVIAKWRGQWWSLSAILNDVSQQHLFCFMAESKEELKSLLMKVKEREKAGIKLSIQKTKIVASCPITSWWIDGETVTSFIFLDSKSLQMVTAATKLKKSLLLGRKAMTNLDSILKSRDITLLTMVHLVKAMIFPVVMYGCELGHTEGCMPKY